MEYRVLGPVEAWDGDRAVALGGAKQRGLPATLLLDAGRVVSVDRLINVIWGAAPPKQAITRVQGLASQLRRSLVESCGTPARLITRAPGYLLELAPGELDLEVFDKLVAAASRHMTAGLMAEAAERLEQALALWQGPPLGGTDAVELLEVEVPRLSALEDRITAELALGRLPGLEGTCPIVLDILEAEQAVELLARLAGAARVAAEPQAAEEIVRLCGYLPLAVRVVGAKLAARPHWALAWLAERLADERHLLNELVVGDLEVRASLATSYHGLDEDARRALRLLGLLDVPDFASWVVAALLDVSVPRAEECIDTLLEAQLLDVGGKDGTGQLRYRLHDLIRVYARERASVEEPETDQLMALRRLLGAWLALTDQAAARLPRVVPRPEHGRTPRWPFDPDVAEALVSDPKAWFDAEQASLMVVVTRASARDMHEGAWDLAATLMFGPLAAGQRFDDWRRMAEAALAATRRAGNRRGEAVLLCGLGLLHYNQDHFSDAERYYRQALTIFTAIGGAHGENLARFGLGIVRQRQTESGEALVAAFPAGVVAMNGATAAITA